MSLFVQSTSFNKSNKKQFSLISLKYISYCVSNYLTYSVTYTKYKANLDVYSSFIYIFTHSKENSLSLTTYQIKEFIWYKEENEKNKVTCYISLHLDVTCKSILEEFANRSNKAYSKLIKLGMQKLYLISPWYADSTYNNEWICV